jgi:hypothetical protein
MEQTVQNLPPDGPAQVQLLLQIEQLAWLFELFGINK